MRLPKLLFCILSVFLVVVSFANSSTIFHPVLHIISPPKSIDFRELEPVNSSSLADFFSIALGYTLPKSHAARISGIHAIRNVLNLPKSLVVLEVFTDDEIVNDAESIRFPLKQVGDLDNQFDILAKRTYGRYPEREPLLLKVEFAEQELIAPDGEYSKILNELQADPEKRLAAALKDEQLSKLVSDGTFDTSLPEARLFLIEIGTAKQLIDAVDKLSKNAKSRRDVFWLEMHGYLQILKSPNLKQGTKFAAQNVLQDLLEEFQERFNTIYGNTLLAVIEQDEATAIQRRMTRSLQADDKKDELRLAHAYEPEFHTAFGTLGFTAFLLIVLSYFLSVATWNMDPGKDSIIYRMTAQRIKKDQ